MPRNFYSGTDAELNFGTIVFNNAIATDYATFGLTQQQQQAYNQVSGVYNAAYAANLSPVTHNKGSTLAKNDARKALRALISRYAMIIAAQPNVTDQMKCNLGLTVRKSPSPMGELGKPDDFKVSLDQIGALTIQWKCKNPKSASGTLYNIWRRLGETGELMFLGAKGKKKFVDTTIPAGTSSITYQFQANRSTTKGPMAMYTVRLGSASAGASLSHTKDAPVKIAA